MPTEVEKFPRIITPLPGPVAQQIIDRDHESVSPSYTRDYPLVAKRGYGAMVEDVDGNVFLDFAAGIAVASTGHCHPEVVAAIQKQAAELIHMSGTDFYYEGMPELAEKLISITPGDQPKRVYFGNSGTEAIETAIKLARYHTSREKFISFFGSFHGRTMGALSLTASRAIQRKHFGSLVPGVFHAHYPDTYRGSTGIRPDHAAEDALAYIEDVLFRRVVAPEDVAGIFIEPIQGEGGYVPAPVEFLMSLQRICRQHDILLIADEVQSGMGRTGRWWASQHAEIEPDIICTAKGIASGLPLSAVIARADVMNWPPGAHASTFGGNPVAIAAALATIDLIDRQYMTNASRIGPFILRHTADWRRRHRIVGDIRGKGLMLGIEIVRDQKTKERAPDLRNRIILSAFKKGLLILGAGENTLRICPPLVIDNEQATFGIDVLDACISEVESST